MNSGSGSPKTVDAYIAGFAKDVQVKLQAVRRTIRKAAPEAEEVISYQIAGYRLDGMLIFFAGYKDHVGIYPIPAGTKAFQRRVAPYRSGRSTVRFPLDKPIPLDLVKEMVRYRMKERAARKKRSAIS
jgi:uncharacterized protein YdhG (YjbR/CyaY superfamily)